MPRRSLRWPTRPGWRNSCARSGRLPLRRQPKAEVKAPAKEPCTAGIPGIEVMDIEAAVQVLWAKDIYAESAMGCTGPLVLVSDANEERAKTLLREAGYIG